MFSTKHAHYVHRLDLHVLETLQANNTVQTQFRFTVWAHLIKPTRRAPKKLRELYNAAGSTPKSLFEPNFIKQI
jgi:hypothetical protein